MEKYTGGRVLSAESGVGLVERFDGERLCRAAGYGKGVRSVGACVYDAR